MIETMHSQSLRAAPVQSEDALWGYVLPEQNSDDIAVTRIDGKVDSPSFIVAKKVGKGSLGRNRYTYDVVSYVPNAHRSPYAIVEENVDLGLEHSYRGVQAVANSRAAKLNNENSKLDREAKKERKRIAARNAFINRYFFR